MSELLIIGSERSEAGIPAAMEILRRGGSALEAVERGLILCEDNLADHYVGTGGLPNARGEVELMHRSWSVHLAHLARLEL